MTRHNAETIELIRQEYVQGVVDANGVRSYPTIDELSKKHSIPSITLYRKSQGEEWKKQKADFQETLRNEIDKEKRKQMAKDSIEFDEKSINEI